MIKTYLSIALLTMLAGCHPKENTEQLKAVNMSLEKSNDFIKDAANRVLMDMEDKTHQPIYKVKANVWFPVMKKVEANTDTLIEVVEKLKGEAAKQTGALKLDNDSVLSLLNKLASFKDNIPAYFNFMDSIESPKVREYLKRDCKNICKSGPLLPGYTDVLNTKQRSAYINKWIDKNLRGSTALMTTVVLNKLKNDLLYTRSVLMDRCSSMVGACDGPGSYSEYYAIAVLNSTYVKRGQTIEVTAGMGAFSFGRRPRVIIAGNEVKLNNNATAIHRFKADGKPGKHSLTVKIEFTNDLGAPAYMNQDLEYEIAKLK